MATTIYGPWVTPYRITGIGADFVRPDRPRSCQVLAPIFSRPRGSSSHESPKVRIFVSYNAFHCAKKLLAAGAGASPQTPPESL